MARLLRKGMPSHLSHLPSVLGRCKALCILGCVEQDLVRTLLQCDLDHICWLCRKRPIEAMMVVIASLILSTGIMLWALVKECVFAIRGSNTSW